MAQHPAITKFGRENPRATGLIAFVFGTLLAYWWLISPLQSAQNHEDNVQLSFAGSMGAIIFLVFGLILLVSGPYFAPVLFPLPGETNDSKRENAAYILSAILVVASLLFYFLFEHYLSTLGYTEH